MMTESTDVSRETSEDLERYARLLLEWNRRINLIGRSTEPTIAMRHIAESSSLTKFAPMTGRWLDLGSGAGLPGVPIAIAGRGSLAMTLIEADRRKCAFLMAVRREIDIPMEIICERAEVARPVAADVIVSRAMAPLELLLSYVRRHGHTDTVAILPKGRRWREEVLEAQRVWRFDLATTPSRFDAEGAVLRIRKLRRIADHDPHP